MSYVSWHALIIDQGGLVTKRCIVTLSPDKQESLNEPVSRGKHRSQQVLNALILPGCDEGEFSKSSAPPAKKQPTFNISMRKIDRVRKRFVKEGFQDSPQGKEGEPGLRQEGGRGLRSPPGRFELQRAGKVSPGGP